MADGFAVRQGDLELIAARMTRSVSEVAGARPPAGHSGQPQVDGAVTLFADAWREGLAVLVAAVRDCSEQVSASAAAYGQTDSAVATAFRMRPE